MLAFVEQALCTESSAGECSPQSKQTLMESQEQTDPELDSRLNWPGGLLREVPGHGRFLIGGAQI